MNKNPQTNRNSSFLAKSAFMYDKAPSQALRSHFSSSGSVSFWYTLSNKRKLGLLDIEDSDWMEALREIAASGLKKKDFVLLKEVTKVRFSYHAFPIELADRAEQPRQYSLQEAQQLR